MTVSGAADAMALSVFGEKNYSLTNASFNSCQPRQKNCVDIPDPLQKTSRN